MSVNIKNIAPLILRFMHNSLKCGSATLIYCDVDTSVYIYPTIIDDRIRYIFNTNVKKASCTNWITKFKDGSTGCGFNMNVSWDLDTEGEHVLDVSIVPSTDRVSFKTGYVSVNISNPWPNNDLFTLVGSVKALKDRGEISDYNIHNIDVEVFITKNYITMMVTPIIKLISNTSIEKDKPRITITRNDGSKVEMVLDSDIQGSVGNKLLATWVVLAEIQ